MHHPWGIDDETPLTSGYIKSISDKLIDLSGKSRLQYYKLNPRVCTGCVKRIANEPELETQHTRPPKICKLEPPCRCTDIGTNTTNNIIDLDDLQHTDFSKISIQTIKQLTLCLLNNVSQETYYSVYMNQQRLNICPHNTSQKTFAFSLT